MTSRPPRAQLATIQLGQPVEQFIADQRADGASWRRIAANLYRATNGATDVTDVTVAAWAALVTPVKHAVTVQHNLNGLHRATCACGWASDGSPDSLDAHDAGSAHLADTREQTA